MKGRKLERVRAVTRLLNPPAVGKKFKLIKPKQTMMSLSAAGKAMVIVEGPFVGEKDGLPVKRGKRYWYCDFTNGNANYWILEECMDDIT